MTRNKNGIAKAKKNLSSARKQLANNRETENSRNRAELETLRKEKIEDAAEIKALKKEVEVMKKKLKESFQKGSHKILNTTTPWRPFDSIKARAKSKRLVFWMNKLIELNDGQELSEKACFALSERLLKKFPKKKIVKLTAEQTGEFFITLGISQNKFNLLYQTLRSYEVTVPFAPYSTFKDFIQKTPPGAYVTVVKNGNTGTVASDIKELMTIQCRTIGL
uniref:SWIB domain-containing protein n=1 Tax=Rhabditophanes sp. KR3021 TaxID=114890 RepID=A0AC35U170_9BILA